jgi:uncharacterized membrane protein YphA (DoxX/SURF4 family)
MEATLQMPAVSVANATPRAKSIIYWIATGLIAFILMSGGILQVTMQQESIDGFVKLGYPVHFAVLLGAWKLLGGLAILAPRFPRLKEWAYAGIFFDFSGAVVVSAVTGSAWHVAPPLVLIGVLVVSWACRPMTRTLSMPVSSPRS